MSSAIVGKSSRLYSYFDPKQIGGCQIWLDASDSSTVSLSGSSVTQWNDKSGNGNHATGGVSPTYVTGGINNLNVVSFDGTSQYMLSQDVYGARSFMIHAVVRRQKTITSQAGFLSGTNATGNAMLHLVWKTNTSIAFAFYANDLAYASFPTFVTSQMEPAYLMSYYFTPGTRQIFINGVLAASDTNATSLSSSTGMRLAFSQNVYWGGYIGELIVYNGIYSQAARQQVEGYLAWKWGLAYYGSPTSITSPLSIPGCYLWLDGSDSSSSSMTLSGSTITSWRDKSGNNNHTTGTVGTVSLVSDAINGLSVASFVNSGLTGPFASSFTGTQLQSFAVVVTTSNNTNVGRILSLSRPGVNDYNNTTSTMFARYSTSIQVGRNAVYLYGATPGYNTAFIIQTGQVASTQFVGINGANPTSGATNVGSAFNITSFATGTSTNTTDLGSRFYGYIGEIIHYRGVILTPFQRQQVEGYLATKWGLLSSLSSTHPFSPSYNPYIMSVGHPYRKNIVFTRYFQPIDVGNCTLWLDASDQSSITLSGSNVTQWNDKSGNGYNATGGVSPTYSNGEVVFDGTQYLTTTYSSVPTAETIFVVATITGTTNAKNFFMVAPTNNNERGFIINLTSGVYTINWNKAGVASYASTSGVQQNVRFLATGLFTGSAGTTGLNGGSQSTSTAFTFSGTGTTKIGAVVSGVSNTSWVGKINEIIIFNSALPSIQYQQVEGYLAWKWGIKSNLPTTHIYKQILPSTNIFNPLSIPNCAMWLDAGDPSTFTYPNGSFQWNDKASNYNFTTGSGLVTPRIDTIPYKNMGCVNFVYYDNQLVSAVNNRITGNAARSMFMVCNLFGVDSIITMGTGNFVTSSPATAFGTGMDMSPGGWNIWAPYIYTANDNSFSSALTGTHFTYSYYSSGTIGGGYNFSGYATKAVGSLSTTAGPWYLGRRPDGAGSLNGGICELIIFSSVLNNADRQKVEGYLAWKWGIQSKLPSSHQYYKYPPS